MTRREKAILALICAAEIINCAKVGVLKSRIADLETQRDIYASRAQHWIDRAVEDEEVIDSITPTETGSGVTGDLPVTSTKGYTANMPLYSETRVEAFTGSPGEAGDSTTGTKPGAATLGTSAAATAGGQVKVEAFKITPRVCGKTYL